MSDPASRKLAAILHADAAGYSRLMADDETATAAALESAREVFRAHVGAHGGRIVDMAGDSVLALFDAATSATQAALAIQSDLSALNAPREEKRRMRFRIAVNLGEVMHSEDGTVYGDGINVAARLQEISEPGGLCVSGAVFDQVEGRQPVRFRSIGPQTVKNIAKPVRAYLAQLDSVHQRRKRLPRFAATVILLAAGLCLAAGAWYLVSGKGGEGRTQAGAAETEPSIAVLPFRNMSGKADDEWFSDGMTETLITDLARVPRLMVISRESTFAYKGKQVDVRQVAKELNVRYVLEGSIQRTSDRLRVNAQLIDGTTGKHMWAERYDRPLDDLFAIQDDLTDHIITEIDVQVAAGPQARAWRGSTRDRRAYELFLRAYQQYFQFNQQGMARAEELSSQALEIDPQFTAAMTLLGFVYYHQGDAGWRRDSAASYRMALDKARQATTVDPLNGNAYSLASSALLTLRRYEEALAAADKAVSVAPNQADVVANSAWTLATAGRAEDALVLVDRAFRLNPFAPPWMYGARGDSLMWSGRVSEALPVFHKCVDPLPDFLYCRLALATAYAKVGRTEDARSHVQAARRINAAITAEDNTYTRGMRVPEERAEVVRALREAGLR